MLFGFKAFLLLISPCGSSCMHRFINMHSSKDTVKYPGCLHHLNPPFFAAVAANKEAKPAIEYFFREIKTTVAGDEKNEISAPSSHHLICEKCLLGELQEMSIFSIRCKRCGKLISYENMLGYAKNVIFRIENRLECHPNSSVSNSMPSKITMKIISAIVGELGLDVLFCSLRYRKRRDLQRFRNFCDRNYSDFENGSSGADYTDLMAAIDGMLEVDEATGQWVVPRATAENYRELSESRRLRYSHSLDFPIASGFVESDAAQYLASFENSSVRSGQIPFVNAKILFICSHSAIQNTLKHVYFLPYLLDLVPKDQKNPVVERYIEDWRIKVDGRNEDYGLILTFIIQHTLRPANDQVLYSLLRQYVRSRSFSLRLLIKALNIKCAMRGKDAQQEEDEELLRDLTIICREVLREYGGISTYDIDISKISDSLEAIGSEALREYAEELKAGYLAACGEQNIPEREKRIIRNLINRGNRAGLTKLVRCYKRPELAHLRFELLEILLSMEPLSGIKIVALNEFFSHEMNLDDSAEALERIKSLSPESHGQCVGAILLYAEELFFNSNLTGIALDKKTRITKNRLMYLMCLKKIQPFTDSLLELEARMRMNFANGEIRDPELLCTYAYAMLHNDLIENYFKDSDAATEKAREQNAKMESYKIKLPTFLHKAIYNRMLDHLTMILMDDTLPHSYIHSIHTLVTSICIMHRVNNKIVFYVNKEKAMCILHTLVWANVYPWLICVPYLNIHMTHIVFMNSLLNEYFNFEYYLRKRAIFSFTLPRYKRIEPEINKEMSAVIRRINAKYRRNEAMLTEQIADDEKLRDFMSKIMLEIVNSDKCDEVLYATSLAEMHPLFQKIMKAAVSQRNKKAGKRGEKVTLLDLLEKAFSQQ